MTEMTRHAMDRMNQRGVTWEMIELTLEYGRRQCDKVILGARDVKKLLRRSIHDFPRRLLMKLLDKGGLVVVVGGDGKIVTVYRR